MFLHSLGKNWRTKMIFCILLIAAAFTVIAYCAWIRLGKYRFIPQDDDVKPATEMKRLNLIIVAHARSGSTLLGEMFNHHPSVFYLFEPLQTVNRVNGRANLTQYERLALQFLNNIFRCNFSDSSLKYFDDLDTFYRRQDHSLLSFAMVSPPLCPYSVTDPRWNPKKCPKLRRQTLEKVCRHDYNVTVIKLILSRVPDSNIRKLWSACNFSESERAECKVIFLVRDPRPVTSSSRQIGLFDKGWKANNNLSLSLYSNTSCAQTEKNIQMLRLIPPWIKGRYKLIRYEDMAVNPLAILREVYEFAGLPVLESVKKWVQNTTQPSKEMETKDKKNTIKIIRTVKNSLNILNKWRKTLASFEVKLIERNCRAVMDLMGFVTTDGSADKLSEVKAPRLFNQNYKAKEWLISD